MCSEAWETRLQFAMLSLKFHATSVTNIGMCSFGKGLLAQAFVPAGQLGKAYISPDWRCLCGSVLQKSLQLSNTNVDMGIWRTMLFVKETEPPVEEKLAHCVWVVSALQLLRAERNLLPLTKLKNWQGCWWTWRCDFEITTATCDDNFEVISITKNEVGTQEGRTQKRNRATWRWLRVRDLFAETCK